MLMSFKNRFLNLLFVLVFLLGVIDSIALFAHRTVYYEPAGEVVVDEHHHHWPHERVFVYHPWYHPDHVYYSDGHYYPNYYSGHPYYYYDPRFYYFQ